MLFRSDGSGSMAEPIRFRGRSATKAEAVAEVADELLFELIERARRDDGVRDYYDIALIGYGGDDRVESLLPDGAETLTVTRSNVHSGLRFVVIREKSITASITPIVPP